MSIIEDPSRRPALSSRLPRFFPLVMQVTLSDLSRGTLPVKAVWLDPAHLSKVVHLDLRAVQVRDTLSVRSRLRLPTLRRPAHPRAITSQSDRSHTHCPRCPWELRQSRSSDDMLTRVRSSRNRKYSERSSIFLRSTTKYLDEMDSDLTEYRWEWAKGSRVHLVTRLD